MYNKPKTKYVDKYKRLGFIRAFVFVAKYSGGVSNKRLPLSKGKALVKNIVAKIITQNFNNHSKLSTLDQSIGVVNFCKNSFAFLKWLQPKKPL